MILYFNSRGQLKEYLEYDSVARAGTTAFKIIAYFEGVNVDNVDDVYVTLYRPDMFHTSVLDGEIEMTVDKTFVFNNEYGDSSYFKNGQTYNVFVLDFNEILGDNDSSLIDMPGLWRVVISIYGSDRNVQGLATVYVQNGITGYRS